MIARFADAKVRRCTDQPPFTHVIYTTRLKFFSHTAPVSPSMDHSRALRACVAPLTRTADCADRVTLGSGLLNPSSHHSTLVWNCLSSSAESLSLEYARRNGNVWHRTSHTMMMMTMKDLWEIQMVSTLIAAPNIDGVGKSQFPTNVSLYRRNGASHIYYGRLIGICMCCSNDDIFSDLEWPISTPDHRNLYILQRLWYLCINWR